MFGLFKKKPAPATLPKPPPPPATECELCGMRVAQDKLENHERSHYSVVIDTRAETGLDGESPYRKEGVRQTVVYRITSSHEDGEKTGRIFITDKIFAKAAARFAREFPANASIQYLPEDYVHGRLGGFHNANGSFLVSILIIIHF